MNSNKMNSARMWMIVFSLLGLLPVEVFQVNIIRILNSHTFVCLEWFSLSHCENYMLFLCGDLYVVIYYLHSHWMWNRDCSLGLCYIFQLVVEVFMVLRNETNLFYMLLLIYKVVFLGIWGGCVSESMYY